MGTRRKQSYIRPPPPYFIVLASSVTTMQVKAIEFHIIAQYALWSFTPSPSARNLGAIFAEHLTMEAHVNSVCRSSFFHLHNISSIRIVLDMETTVFIVQALVISRPDHCNSLICGLLRLVASSFRRLGSPI